MEHNFAAHALSRDIRRDKKSHMNTEIIHDHLTQVAYSYELYCTTATVLQVISIY